tara:strand:+ start:34 stop:663 length:630 start_codon:yes stop_codon:yes gene_type:complete
VGEAILTRNLPFGIILTPVRGSKFNPFNGNSMIDSFEGDVVARSARTLPTINTSDNEFANSELTETNLYNRTGSASFGLVESGDFQNIGYFFSSIESKLINNFYSNGLYTSSPPELNNYGYSYLINNILDPLLTDNPTVEEITWWDIYSRLPINRLCEILYDKTVDLHQKLTNGLREDVKIKNVLGVLGDEDVTILDNDSPVINSSYRD